MEETQQDIGKQICYASVLFRRNFDHVVASQSAGYTDSLSGRNIWVLRYIQEHSGEDVFQKDLETAFKLRRSTISNTVDLMERKQLLVRESVNGDARLKRLRLTPKAEEILAKVSQEVDRMEEYVRMAFSPEDYSSLMNLLQQLCSVLETPLPGSTENSTRKE